MVIERIIYSWIIQLKDWKNLNALTQSYNVFRGFLNRWYGVKPIKIHMKIVCLDSKKILTKSIYTKMFFYYCFGFTFHFYFYIIFGI